MSYVYPTVGAQYKERGKCTFTVWAPHKERVELAIQDEYHPMKVDERGYWSVEIEGVLPGTSYGFRIDRDKTLPDPASRAQPDGIHAPSVVTTLAFDWTDHAWKGLPLSDMIIYELHVGTFTAQGDFAGVRKKLDYLKDLGVNTIELMPVAQFPGSRNWGYDGVYPFAVQHAYGGLTGLKELVNEAHRRDIAVILDVVYNHQGPEGNYLAAYGPYFSDKYKTFWGSAVNFDDAYCDGVRNFYWQNALMWLDEFRIDGLRLDAVHAIWDYSATHFIEALAQKVRKLESHSGRKKVLIAELDLNNPRYIRPASEGGYGMDGQWIDEFHHALHALLTGEVNGYYEDFGSPKHLAKALQHGYVYTGEYSVHRKKHFGRPHDNPARQFVVFSQNHDQVGNRMLGDRLSTQLSFEALKLTAATVLLAPQVPMLFMGEEYGERNPFQYFISHTDESLIEMVRKGRREEFSYFNWQGEVPDPQSEKTFKQCVLSWNDAEDTRGRKLFQFYKYLIRLRKERKAFQGGTSDTIKVFDPGEGKVIAYLQHAENDHVLVVLNFDQVVVPFTLPVAGPVKKIFDSSALSWGGPGELGPQSGDERTFLLHPESVVLFEY